MKAATHREAYLPQRVCGVDEAGRGPLAGAVFAAAVILDAQRPIDGLRDSKQLTEKKRIKLAADIQDRAIAWCVASADVAEIDTLNILQASLLAMKRAIEGLTVKPDEVIVDGIHLPPMPFRGRAEIEADRRFAEVSAASILAKVARDAVMVALDAVYPVYGFARHKGYGTADHLQALRQHGPCPVHRRSFAPVRLAEAQGRLPW